MHLVRLDIDKKNAASQYHVGPLGAGLNAVYSPLVANSTLLTRFTKSLLFRGQTLGELDDSEFASIDGSVTWVDASGHLRMIDCVGGRPLFAQLSNSGPSSTGSLYQEDDERVRGNGHMFWEGESADGRWDELRADILGMVFCSPLGSVSPEKLWWAAGRLGVHAPAKMEVDQGYKALKDEETELLERLRNCDPVDHDRTWWIAERDRLRGQLQQVQQHNFEQSLSVGSSASEVSPSAGVQSKASWDDSQINQQLSHAELMIQRWNQRGLWHQRLAQVQSSLLTRSVYRRTSTGSLIPSAERFLSELTAGAVRQLPTWAVEASYLHSEAYNAGLRYDVVDGQIPPAETRQRRLVDLAIRLAIAQASRSRIGRIPFLLENSLDGFRGEPLEQILHVVSNFSRDGWQMLLTTSDEFIARRIAGHGGTVARVHENLRYAKPKYVIDSDTDLGLHPVLDRAPVVQYSGGYSGDFAEVNRQLDWLAHHEESQVPHRIEPMVYQRQGKTFYLSKESPIDTLAGLSSETVRRLRSVGIHRVGDFLGASAQRLASVTGLRLEWIQNTLGVAELMCQIPQMRVFDARVLVSCGIQSSKELGATDPLVIAKRIHRFLETEAGKSLRGTAQSGELVRLQRWIQSVYQQHGLAAQSQAQTVDFDWDAIERKSKSAGVDSVAPAYDLQDDPDFREDAGQAVAKFNLYAGKSDVTWKFFLDLSSPVVDAPTIGPKMAQKLESIRVKTIGDLLAAESGDIAQAIGEKSVTAATVDSWKSQSMLVCRIPNLRGQDAQLLVAAGYSTAESIADASKDTLVEAIARVASTKQGLRYLRGGNPPDAERIGSWIQWSKHSRMVKAA
ncbi:MAG: DUF4332 domain-containing protein [Planctomycetes bacterium]|nr:DUF4332 domain-containing protein [Planctomycetota bacterium]